MSNIIPVHLGLVRGTLGPGQRQTMKLKGIKPDKIPVLLCYTTTQHVVTKANLGLPEGLPECNLILAHPNIVVMFDGRRINHHDGIAWIDDKTEISIDFWNSSDHITPEPAQIGFLPGRLR